MSSVYSLTDSVATEPQQPEVAAAGTVLGAGSEVVGDKNEWPSEGKLLRAMAFILATRFKGVSDEDGVGHCSANLIRHIDEGMNDGLYSGSVARGLKDYMEGFFMENPEHVGDLSDSDDSFVPSDTESDSDDDSEASEASEASSGFYSEVSALTETPTVVSAPRTRSNSVASSVTPRKLDFDEESTVPLPPAKRSRLLVQRAWPTVRALQRTDRPLLALPPVVIDLTEDSD